LLLFPLWAGASVYYPDGAYTPSRMVELMAQVGCTVCYTAPTFYRQMAPLIQQHPVPTLRISVSAGEALPDATRQLWKQASGLEMIDGIGATEMFHIFISAAGADVRAGSIGKVVPGYQARVVDDQGQELPRGTVGRLAVIGPTGCRYLDDSRQTKYVRHGWNYPGDTFIQDEAGYFYYQARDDDMIITAGYNVGGPEVEDALLQHPAVAECGVVAKPDAERGMIVKAYCVLRAGHPASPELVKQLQDHVKSHLARTNTHARSNFWHNCHAPRPASYNAFACVRWRRPERLLQRLQHQFVERLGPLVHHPMPCIGYHVKGHQSAALQGLSHFIQTPRVEHIMLAPKCVDGASPALLQLQQHITARDAASTHAVT